METVDLAVYAAIAAVRARRSQPKMRTREFAETYRNFKAPIPWFHDIWYEALDDPTFERLYIQGPREHAKTTTVLTWAENQLSDNHHLRVGIVSGDDDLAMKFLKELKHEFEANVQLRADRNGGRPWVGDKWTEHELVLADAREGPDGISGKDVSVFSVGQGAQISSRHCDILIVDDVESARTVKSDLVRQGTREWWAREVAPVLSPGGKMVVVGTRKHFDDLYAHIIAGDVGGEDTETSSPWRVVDVAKSVWKENGDPIWPEFWSRPRLLKRKAELDQVDLLAWPQEYLNEPRASNVQMFYPEKWPTYGKAPWGLTIYQYWDLAISEKTTADYTVGWTIGVSDDNDVYLLEQRRGHWDFNRTLAEIGDMGRLWSGPDSSGTLAAVGIEAIAYQAAAVQEAVRRTMLPVVPITHRERNGKGPQEDKVTRARLLEARAAASKVLRPDPAPDWWHDFAVEAYYFPDGPHDDQVDGLSGAVRMAGWTSDQVGYAYGVWTCVKCGHMFVWQAKRPCPSCGTAAPEEFENPEQTRAGELGADIDAQRAREHESDAPARPKVRTLQDEIYAMIYDGHPLPRDRALADWPVWREALMDVAARLSDEEQGVRVAIALDQVRVLDRLDEERRRPVTPIADPGFTVIVNPTVRGSNGNGSHA